MSGAMAMAARPPRVSRCDALLLAGALAGLALAVQCGAVPVAGADWFAVFAPAGAEPMTGGAYVLWHLRLPRAIFALVVGAALGLSGALTQGLFRNPLADPSLLGVTGGAACAAALTIVLAGSLNMAIPAPLRIWVLPAAGFAGAVGVCFALDRAARWITPGSIAGLLLTGVALNALVMAVIGLCTYLATDEQLRSLTFWTLGSLAGASWMAVAVLALLVGFGLWQARRLGRVLNALALGESTAAHIGVDVGRVRRRVIVLVAILTGFAVALCGMIGFIGLVAPHMVRALSGPDQRVVLPQSMLVGALLLLLADTVARTVAIPAEIPVGIFTALLGTPFFLFLLCKARGRIG